MSSKNTDMNVVDTRRGQLSAQGENPWSDKEAIAMIENTTIRPNNAVYCVFHRDSHEPWGWGLVGIVANEETARQEARQRVYPNNQTAYGLVSMGDLTPPAPDFDDEDYDPNEDHETEAKWEENLTVFIDDGVFGKPDIRVITPSDYAF